MSGLPPHLQEDGLTLADFMPGDGRKRGEGFRAIRGEALPAGAEWASQIQLIAAIQTVHDPEIPVNLWDLGLIYRLEQLINGDLEVEMTLTAPGCPVAGEMPAMVAEALAKVPGTGIVTVSLVWEPAWHKGLMSEDARMLLDL